MYTELRKQLPRTWRIWHRMNWRCERYDLFPCYEDVDICDRWNRQVSGEDAFINFVADIGDLDTQELFIYRLNCWQGWTPKNTATKTHRDFHAHNRWHKDPANKYKLIAKANGISNATLRTRLENGWSTKRAITQPVKHKQRG